MRFAFEQRSSAQRDHWFVGVTWGSANALIGSKFSRANANRFQYRFDTFSCRQSSQQFIFGNEMMQYNDSRYWRDVMPFKMAEEASWIALHLLFGFVPRFATYASRRLFK